MKFIIKAFLVLILVAFSACENDNNIPLNEITESGDTNPFLQNFGNAIQSRFMGTVVNEQNNPIAGATISIGSQYTTTDANGVFSVLSASVYENYAYVKATKPGFSNGSRAVVPSPGVNQVKIMLLNLDPVATINTGQAETVNLPDGTEVVLPANYVNQSGAPYQGAVNVVLKHLNVDTEEMKWQMPGSLLGENANGDLIIMETVGMIAVELLDDAGETLNIAPGELATISIPVGSSVTNPPASIPLWYFDEANGYWKEEGVGELVGNKFVGEVSHFSFWNWDFQYPAVTVCITVQDANGNVLPNTALSLYSPALNATGMYGYTNTSGVDCGFVPQDDILTLVVPDYGCPNTNFTTTIGPFSQDESITITVPNSSSAATTNFTATFNNCDGDAITSGYLQLSYNNNTLIIPITDGEVAQSIAYCTTNTAYTAQVTDLASGQSTTLLSGNFTAPTTALGTALSCVDLLDNDNDGLTNIEELTGVNNPQSNCNPNGNITDPNNADTDGDGYDDCEEAVAGTDPNDANSFPNSTVFNCCNNDTLSGLDVNTIANSQDDVQLYDIITPNGDGFNEVFQIDNMALYANNSFRVYNENDELVYETTAYATANNFFSGTNSFTNVSLPDGTYRYELIFDADGQENIRNGFVCLVTQIYAAGTFGSGCNLSDASDPIIG